MANVKYATEEERKEARKEQLRQNNAKRRALIAKAEGREVKGRRTFESEEERKEARKEKKEKYREKKGEKGWEPYFVGVDGESFLTGRIIERDGKQVEEQAYCLLLRSDKQTLYNPQGLSTFECLEYLSKRTPKRAALVGYFLNFDFEWILKDVTEEEYKELARGHVTSVLGDDCFRLQWIKNKKLVIYRVFGSSMKKPPEERTLKDDFFPVTIQDTAGFFQSSFVSALEKWGFSKDEEGFKTIIDGKKHRGGFLHSEWKEVAYYNKQEMIYLEALMLKVWDAFKKGYEASGLKFRVKSTSWTGPGEFATDFLNQTNWVEEHEAPRQELIEEFMEGQAHYLPPGNTDAKNYPFALAYFGGRIELAGIGKFKPNRATRRKNAKKGAAVYNDDINSAYPYALSLLGKWKMDDFRLEDFTFVNANNKMIQAFLSRRLMGMYEVKFNFPDGWTWYPFPVRNKGASGYNVYYPKHGTTHIMSPELFAALDTLTKEERSYIQIGKVFYLEATDGRGDALRKNTGTIEGEELCETAIKTFEMAKFRLDCKAAKNRLGTPEEQPNDSFLAMAEKALKLILNSLYGKTVQQVGKHKHYNDFASAWITSVCRALIWRALAPERKTNNVLMTMTDGIYSQVPLKFPVEGDYLGQWEEENFSYFETFKPGIYRYEKKGKMNYRVRGYLAPSTEDKELLFSKIWDSMEGTPGEFPTKMFIPRILALKGWKREPFKWQFLTEPKRIESDLSAKRLRNNGTGWLLPEGSEQGFFKPKIGGQNLSIGYDLKFADPELPKEEEIEEYIEKEDSRFAMEDFFDNVG